jgi:hypothetical protein
LKVRWRTGTTDRNVKADALVQIRQPSFGRHLDAKERQMNSTVNLDAGNPDADLAVRADQRLTHAYEQIARADEQLVRVTEKLSKMELEAARHPSMVIDPARGRPLLRGLVGLALAACIGAAAYASHSPYGETTRLTVAQWAPFLFSTSSPWSAPPANATQPNPPAIRLASADTAAPQPAPSPQSPVQDAASTRNLIPPELTQLLQNMARDIATVEQGIEQLKASHEQLAADHARAIEQLRAGQEQLTRLAARPPVQDQRAKTPVPTSPPVASATRKPPQPPQARARPQPVQLVPDDQ